MKTIIVNSKKHGTHNVLVDDEDYENLSKFKWNIFKKETDNTLYCKRNSKRDPITRKQKTITMHRLIMNVFEGKGIIDHKDHNGLNNQKSNLRICNTSQNGANRLKNKNASSKYYGVCYAKRSKKWNAFLQTKRTSANLGYFDSEEDAARHRDKIAYERYGEFAILNFPI